MQITMIRILTIGGTLPWIEEDTLDVETDVLYPNGIYLRGPMMMEQGVYFCPVDTQKTNLTDFYEWTEISPNDTETFCWRTFYITGEAKNYRGWLPIPSTEMFGSYHYQDIFDKIQEYTAKVI